MALPSLATVKLIAVAVLAAVLVLTGWTARGWKEDAERLDEQLQANATLLKNIRLWAGINRTTSAQLAAERQTWNRDRLKFEEKLRRANPKKLVTCDPQKDSQPAGDAAPTFQPDFVQLWNDALEQGATEAERAGRAAADAAAAPLSDPREILGNLGENSRRWAECRAQVRGWQAWATSHGFMD